MAKILITGFQRSGTTLFRRLIENHPDIQWMGHERRVLDKITSREKLPFILKKFKYWKGDISGHWGEKVPWQDPTGQSIINYIQKWNNHFSDEARILHVVRNPVDVAASNMKLKWFPNYDRVISTWKSSVPNILSVLNNSKNGKTILYEDLVTNPSFVLREVFKFCELEYTEEILSKICNLKKDKLRYFDKIDSSRAFVHTELGGVDRTDLLKWYDDNFARYRITR